MKRLFAVLSALSTPASSAAAQPQVMPAPLFVGQSWSPEWNAPFCTISTGEPKQLALSIWYVPGSGGVEIYFMSDPARARGYPGLDQRFDQQGRIIQFSGIGADVQFAERGPLIPVTALQTIPAATGVIGFAMSVSDFFGNFASSDRLNVSQAVKSIGIRYSGSAEAIIALRQCIETRLKEWGVNSAALAALKRRPVLRLDSWVRYADFPSEALADKRAGTTVVRLTTDTAGKVTSCAVVESSGVPVLDDVTCNKALTRSRYKPAIGSDGKRIPATFTNYVRFDVLQ